MANEFYRLELAIDVTGDDQAKGKLKAFDNFIKHTRKQGEMLNRMQVSPAVRLVDRISAPLRTVERNLNRLNTVKKVTIEAVDKTTSVVKRITNALTSPMAILGAGAGVAGAIGYPLKLAGEMEQTNIAMETMLGSTKKAQQFLSDLADFAVKTPFEMPQLRDASRRLLAFGFSAEQVIPTLTAVGDAASGLGLGEEGLNRIVTALGQMRAKAKVSADEMLQLTEAGIPAWDILSKAMGKSTAEVMKLSEKGLIPANKAIDALVKGMEERFPKMMERQSRSLFGLLSTLKDYANLKFFWAFGEGIRQAAVPALQRFTDMLTGNEKGLKKVQDRLMELGRTVGTWVVSKLEALYKWFEKLSSDETFKRMSFGDKLVYVINQALDSVSNWLDGPGGKRVEEIFIKLGGIAARAWWTGLKGTAKGSVEALLHGNIAGALAMMMGFSILGGGLFLRGGWGVLKTLGKGASWLSKTGPATKAGESLRRLFFGEDILQLGKEAAPAGVAKAVRRVRGIRASEITEAVKTVEGIKTAEVVGLASKVGRFSKAFGIVGKIALPLAVAGDVVEFATSKTKVKTGAQIAGGWGGMLAGAKLGAMAGGALGSVIPGIGNVIGVAAGGLIGGLGGYFGGRWLGSKVGGKIQEKITPAPAATADADMRGYLSKNVYEPFREYVNRATSWGRNLILNFMRGRDSAGMSMAGWLNWQVYLPFRSIVVRATSWGRNMMLNFITGMQQVKVPPVSIPRPTTAAAAAPVKKHAYGGILTRPHLGLIAEAGPEVIIPLSARLRTRALDLWQRTGEYLGVKPYAGGGFAGPVPAVAGAVDGGNVNVTIAGITIHVAGTELDEDALALRIGRYIVGEIKKSLENRT